QFQVSSRVLGRNHGNPDTAGRRETSRANPNNRLPRASLGGVEGGDGIGERGNGANVRPQSSVTHLLDDRAVLGPIGPDNAIDRQPVIGPCLARPDDGYERATCPDQARGPLPDIAADEIEHEIDAPDVFQGVVLEVDELLRPEVKRLLTV